MCLDQVIPQQCSLRPQGATLYTWLIPQLINHILCGFHSRYMYHVCVGLLREVLLCKYIHVHVHCMYSILSSLLYTCGVHYIVCMLPFSWLKDVLPRQQGQCVVLHVHQSSLPGPSLMEQVVVMDQGTAASW